MSDETSGKHSRLFLFTVAVTAVFTVTVVFLLLNIFEKKQEAAVSPARVAEIGEDEIDPEIWGRNFPLEYDTFIKTQENYGKTPYGGSEPYSKLERYPAMIRLWAGYSFSKGHNEERGHHYAAVDQANIIRVKVVNQPGACVNCHAAEAPGLIEEMGWQRFNSTPYNDLKPHLKTGTSCADCHDPHTMDLRITRPALIHALEAEGVDWTQATRQEMRSLVCAQCHVEYYFKGEHNILTFPWSKGRTIDDIEAHYDEYGFTDWTHAESGAPMIKMQHPEFELWGTGVHAASGVSCADCHMPYIRKGSVKISDHWIRSPLHNPGQSCQTCHSIPVAELEERVRTIQDRTAKLLRRSEDALLAAIDSIVEAKEKGIEEPALKKALHLHRSAQMRWDFISSENSTGFHSPQESARILAECLDLARQAEIEAINTLRRQ